MYPFDRALTFSQEIKKLEADSGNNALDECRVVISEMGNIVSLVRMVRAAKRRVLSDEMPFLSAYSAADTAEGFKDNNSTKDSNTTSAKSGVDDAVSDILQKSDPDFVRAFVNVFQGVIKKSESGSSVMCSFFCIVPAICLCWMENSHMGKEMMHKKNITRDGYYTDDGFAVGLAFALSVFGQTKSYNRYVTGVKMCVNIQFSTFAAFVYTWVSSQHVSLNWFQSIQSKYASDEEDLMEKKNAQEVYRNAKLAASKQSSWFSSSIEVNNKEEDEEMTILNLLGKRLDGNKREMAMLFFSIHVALSFFKDNHSG
jgi:WASH complex subunit 7